MELFNIPAFGEECIENQTNSTSRVFVLSNIGEDLFDKYCELLKNAGFKNREECIQNTT